MDIPHPTYTNMDMPHQPPIQSIQPTNIMVLPPEPAVSEPDDKNNHYPCSNCSKVLSSKGSLKRHENLHVIKSSRQHLPCQQCNKVFNSASNLNAHEKTHNGDKPHKCKICDLRFLWAYQLKKHTQVHQRKPYQCQQCYRCFGSSSELVTHEQIHCVNGEKQYTCSQCNYVTNQSKNLKKHMTTHEKIGTQKCGYCELEFSNATELKWHEMIHTGEQYKQDKISCSICMLLFSTKQDLYHHMVKKHSLQIHMNVENDPYVCEYCHRGFKRKENLQKHYSIHRKQKLHCQLCGLLFKERQHLDLHTRKKHTPGYPLRLEERPYKCETCGNAYSQKSLLAEHLSSHSREKCQCQECGVYFKERLHLEKHILKMHKSSEDSLQVNSNCNKEESVIETSSINKQ